MPAPRPGLPPLHLALALAVAAVWGSNFVVMRFALEHLPPLTLALLRFALAFCPLAFFVKRPEVSWGNLALYGSLIGAGQFGLLFTAMKADITPGLASLVIQSQAFFTIGLAVAIERERLRAFQIAALGLAATGITVIALNAQGSATPLGLALVLTAAACWASANLVNRAAGPVNMLGYVAWSSLFALPPLLALALLLEGWPAMREGIALADWKTWSAVGWQSVGNTLFGYGAWGWLLARHEAASVAPLSLMVPVFGMLTSAAVLGEPMQEWKIAAFVLVMAGLALGVIWPRLIAGRIR